MFQRKLHGVVPGNGIFMARMTVCLAINFVSIISTVASVFQLKLSVSITRAQEEKNYCSPISVSPSVCTATIQTLVRFSIRRYQCSPTPGLSYHSVKEDDPPHSVLSQATDYV